MKLKLNLSFKVAFATLFICQLLVAQASAAKITGQVLERGTKIPLKEVAVFLMPEKIRVETDTQGRFSIEVEREAPFEFLINVSGYLRFNKVFDGNQVVLFVERERTSLFETTVVDVQQKRDSAKKSLTQEQFLTLPGSQGDPVKAVQNLPGVNRAGGFSSQVVIQGSAPKDTSYLLDGHSIPLVFHFGGLTSVVMPEAIEQVDYLSAGYNVEYGRALGGQIDLRTRDPNVSERSQKGFFFVDSLKAGGLYEAKISESQSILLSGRYSYIGAVLRRAFANREDLNLTVAPEFTDLTLVHLYKPNNRDKLKTTFLSSSDTLEFLFKQPVNDDPALRGTFSNATQFWRVVPQWDRKWSDTRSTQLSLGYGQNDIKVQASDNFFNLKSTALTTRGEWKEEVNSLWTSYLGFDNEYNRATVNLRLPVIDNAGGVSSPFSSGAIREVNVTGKNSLTALYWNNDYLIKADQRWLLQPGLRWDRFQITSENFLMPRMALQFKENSKLTWRTAYGQYSQAPEPQEVADNFGNPEIRSPVATHWLLGFERDLKSEGSDLGWSLNSSLFYRDFKRLVVSSSKLITRNGVQVREAFNNSGSGKAYGLELMAKYKTLKYDGFVSYTLSRSTRQDELQSEYNFEFDQTHNLNWVIQTPLSAKWTLGSRARFVTGNPYTPVTGAVFDADRDTYLPTRGPIYSERFQDFFQWDLRFDRKWIYDQSVWSFYADIQNVLNTQNPESIRYAYNYSKKSTINGLPIAPAIGVKGEF